ncbi:hypothetical protein ElyMa_005472100 [Elysia marginata]|uniref:Uncharacterized protein n=1 Tax=Elysia marginata TaxID=1093978 RepID=A0AAV4EPD9_9GAST|nr:hypothetical protein ElyMa_005472100 [Elysia marginata]
MCKISNAQQVANEMDGYHLGILGLSEVRWNQSGEQRLATGHIVIILDSRHPGQQAHYTERRTENQIDRILCMNKSFRTSLRDIRAYRGADVGSDYLFFVLAKMKLELRKRQTSTSLRPKYNNESPIDLE